MIESEILEKEHSDLIEKILSLDIECNSTSNSRYLKALDYLKALVNLLEIQKLYKQYFEGHISSLNDRVQTPFSVSNNDIIEENDKLDPNNINKENKSNYQNKLQLGLNSNVDEESSKISKTKTLLKNTKINNMSSYIKNNNIIKSKINNMK